MANNAKGLGLLVSVVVIAIASFSFARPKKIPPGKVFSFTFRNISDPHAEAVLNIFNNYGEILKWELGNDLTVEWQERILGNVEYLKKDINSIPSSNFRTVS